MRAYLRLDPNLPDNKADYPDGAYRAYIEVLCFAEQQPQRGRFRDMGVLRAYLVKRARWIPFLIEHGDLIPQDDKTVYVDGWDEWQEGDVTVQERMKRVRARRGSPDPVPGATRTANWRLRNKVFERDNYTCRYCGNGEYPREWLVLEHVIPDGPTDESNLVTACRPCNKLKGPRTPDGAGMVLRDEPVTRHGDATSDEVTPSSGGGKRLAQGGDGPARYVGDVRKAFHHVTGRLPDEPEMKWLEELCRDLGREHVVDALYADPKPSTRGILGRISRKLRGAA